MGDCDGWEQKPITNADRIRDMTDEELADFLCVGDCYYCPAGDEVRKKCKWDNGRQRYTGLIEWLKQEADDEKYCK
jgi:hypothetical protein